MNFESLGSADMKKAKHLRTFAVTLLVCPLFTLVGCETPPSVVEQNFGSSVRNAIALQTAPPSEKPSGLDGEKAEAVLEAYRGDVAKPEQAERELIQINLGD